jgi:DNA-binding transcriptional ArsR family regulator
MQTGLRAISDPKRGQTLDLLKSGKKSAGELS